MSSSQEVLVFVKKQPQLIQVRSMTVLGGSESSGTVIPGLKSKGDYAILTVERSGELMVHTLKGPRRQTQTLAALSPVEIDDLTLVVLPVRSESAETAMAAEGAAVLTTNWSEMWRSVLDEFGHSQDLTAAIEKTLEFVLTQFRFDKGLVIVKQPVGEFEVLVSQGVEANDPWLSETVVKEVLEKKQPVHIRNLVGSAFQNNQSLVATGFLSLHVWPLLVRGQAVGLFLVGSRKPHSGLSEGEERDVQCLCQLSALLIHFHLREENLKQQLRALQSARAVDGEPFDSQNSKVREVVQIARQIAATDLSILILGETGVGKEVLAKWIHEKSERRQGAFVAVNCAAIPRELLESTLFGHKRGAFTGAVSDMVGKFQLAHGGTLFLDEIGELPLALQAKLLRSLQEKVIEPLGSTRSVRTDVRVVAATLKPLAAMVTEKSFRDDLYFRLAEVTLLIPPLRERPEDIRILAAQFLKGYAPQKQFSKSAWDWLQTEKWPGNVRELKSAIHRASVLAAGNEITIRDFQRGLPAAASGSESHWLGGADLQQAKEHFILEKVRAALIRSNGHRGKAAEMLGITIRTLFRYLDQFQGELRDVTDVSHPHDEAVQ